MSAHAEKLMAVGHNWPGVQRLALRKRFDLLLDHHQLIDG